MEKNTRGTKACNELWHIYAMSTAHGQSSIWMFFLFWHGQGALQQDARAHPEQILICFVIEQGFFAPCRVLVHLFLPVDVPVAQVVEELVERAQPVLHERSHQRIEDQTVAIQERSVEGVMVTRQELVSERILEQIVDVRFTTRQEAER